MKTIDEFEAIYSKSEKNCVWVFHLGEFKQAFFSSDPVFEAVRYLNRYLKNFRLKGVTLFCVFEPSLKETGLMLLSRVERVLYLKKNHPEDRSFLDKFLIHRLEWEHYERT
ncbi:MAG: hypothetical protein FJZ62_04875 [Chlamydiae bacterium]|nr:hypothetical protein [Chlamydiota bacterium]